MLLNPGCKQLLQQAHFPHYVNYSTRNRVLRAYKALHKGCRQFFDPHVRSFLQQYVYESFVAYKYVSHPGRIGALVDMANSDAKLIESANRRNSKAAESVLDRAFRKMYVSELPTYTLHHVKRLDHSLVYNIVHLQGPNTTTTQAEHSNKLKAAATKSLQEWSSKQEFVFYRFIHMLKQNKVNQGLNGRKLQLDIRLPGTVLGQNLPACREKNIVSKTYARLCQDAPYPVHRQVLDYIEGRIADKSLGRFYRRRLAACRKNYYTVDDDFQMIR